MRNSVGLHICSACASDIRFFDMFAMKFFGSLGPEKKNVRNVNRTKIMTSRHTSANCEISIKKLVDFWVREVRNVCGNYEFRWRAKCEMT